MEFINPVKSIPHINTDVFFYFQFGVLSFPSHSILTRQITLTIIHLSRRGVWSISISVVHVISQIEMFSLKACFI